jgi:sporulation protein YlmC with PRC-barrel domain
MAQDLHHRRQSGERYRDEEDDRRFGRNQERGYGREMSGHDYRQGRTFGRDRFTGGPSREEERYEDRGSRGSERDRGFVAGGDRSREGFGQSGLGGRGRYESGDVYGRERFEQGGYGQDRYDRDYRGFDQASSERHAERGENPYYRESDRDRGRLFGDWDRQREMRGPDAQFGNRDRERPLAVDETSRLIASNKVEGTAVYSRQGDRLGTIYNFMVNKRSGHVEYAVMTFGGFLGIGQGYYPLPWQMLSYDKNKDGYRVDISERDLERAPRYRRGDEPQYDEDYDRYVYGHYGLPI